MEEYLLLSKMEPALLFFRYIGQIIIGLASV